MIYVVICAFWNAVVFGQARGIVERGMGANHKPVRVSDYELETFTEKAIIAVLLVVLLLSIYWNMRPGIMKFRADRIKKKRESRKQKID